MARSTDRESRFEDLRTEARAEFGDEPAASPRLEQYEAALATAEMALGYLHDERARRADLRERRRAAAERDDA